MQNLQPPTDGRSGCCFFQADEVARAAGAEVRWELEEVTQGISEPRLGHERGLRHPDQSGRYLLGLEIGGAEGIVEGTFRQTRPRRGPEEIGLGERIPAAS